MLAGPAHLGAHAHGMENTQRLKLIAATLAAATLLASERAEPAPVSDLCMSTLAALRQLLPSTDTACMLRVGQQGLALSFNTSAPLFEDPIHGKTYMAYLFGSVGSLLNKSRDPGVLGSIEITNPALIRKGQKFHVQAADVKNLQRQAVSGEASMSAFYEGLIMRGRLVSAED
jgi:hypothetical protein